MTLAALVPVLRDYPVTRLMHRFPVRGLWYHQEEVHSDIARGTVVMEVSVKCPSGERGYAESFIVFWLWAVLEPNEIITAKLVVAPS